MAWPRRAAWLDVRELTRPAITSWSSAELRQDGGSGSGRPARRSFADIAPALCGRLGARLGAWLAAGCHRVAPDRCCSGWPRWPQSVTASGLRIGGREGYGNAIRASSSRFRQWGLGGHRWRPGAALIDGWQVLSALFLLAMGGIHLYLVFHGVGGMLGVLFVLNAIGARACAGDRHGRPSTATPAGGKCT
jgi:hypothetical protein